MTTDNMDFYEHAEKATDTTIQALKEKCEKMYELRAESEALSNQAKDKTREWRKLESQIVELLNDHGMTNFDMGEGRKITLTKHSAVDLPSDQADYESLMQFIESGHEKFFFTLNKTKLRAFIKSEREGRGDENWLPPGVFGEETSYTLSMKGRKSGPPTN